MSEKIPAEDAAADTRRVKALIESGLLIQNGFNEYWKMAVVKDRKTGKGTGRHIACLILKPAKEPQVTIGITPREGRRKSSSQRHRMLAAAHTST
jgi:hypothetical protein